MAEEQKSRSMRLLRQKKLIQAEARLQPLHIPETIVMDMVLSLDESNQMI